MTTSASYATLVQELYVAYFGRPADPAGLQNFEADLAAANAPTTLLGLAGEYGSNAAVTALVNAFGDSAESGRLYGTAIGSNAFAAQQFVTAVFENLFDRAPLQAGLQFWSNALQTGAMTPGEAAMEIALGAAPADASTFNNKISAASVFTADLVTDNATLAYKGPVAASDGRAFLAGINGSSTAAGWQAGATIAIDNMLGISTSSNAPPMLLSEGGDSVHLNGTASASTVNLLGTDLLNYPDSGYGTVAALVAARIASVTDNGGNFTLDASGNAGATTFDFGTGAVSGADAASSAGISYGGVTTYVTSTHGDTVTLSGATQDVTASSGGNTINLGNLAYIGTLDLEAGSGSDTIHAIVGGNLSGATIIGADGGAQINLVLSGAGTETLSAGEYLAITSVSGGSISFTNGSFATDHITFSDAGDLTAIAGVGNYTLSSFGEVFTLTDDADNVTGAASGNNTLNLGTLTYTGHIALGAAGDDTITATVGGNLSGGAITSGGASVELELSGEGTETLSAAEYNLFRSSSSIVFDNTVNPQDNTIVFSDAGSFVDTGYARNYVLSATGASSIGLNYSGENVTLNNAADGVDSSNGVSTTVDIDVAHFTGTLAFGSNSADTVVVMPGSDISGATITTLGDPLALEFNGGGSETMSVEQYNLFANGGGISVLNTQGASNGTIVFSDGGSVVDVTSIHNYVLSSTGSILMSFFDGGSYTVTVNNAADIVTGAEPGNVTVNLGSLAFAGGLNFVPGGTATVEATIGGDLSAATLYVSGGDPYRLALSGDGNESMTATEYNVFNNGQGFSFANTAGTSHDTITFTDDYNGHVSDNASVGNYVFATAVFATFNMSHGNETVTFESPDTDIDNIVNITSTGGDTIDLGAYRFAGQISFSGSGTDTVNMTVGGDINWATWSNVDTVIDLAIKGDGTVSIDSYLVDLLHNSGGSIMPTGTVALDIPDDFATVSLSGQENALTSVAFLGGYNTINVSVGAASVNNGAAGFDKTIDDPSATGNNTVTIDNGAATIVGAADASHYVTLTNFQWTSTIALTLSGHDQNGGEQDIGGAGGQTISVGNNGVIVDTNLGQVTGYATFNATDLAAAEANMLRIVNAATATTGEYAFVIDTNQGAGIYEIHINQGTSSIDGIQLIGVVSNVQVAQLAGHFS